jgi:hypothetical protein
MICKDKEIVVMKDATTLGENGRQLPRERFRICVLYFTGTPRRHGRRQIEDLI